MRPSEHRCRTPRPAGRDLRSNGRTRRRLRLLDRSHARTSTARARTVCWGHGFTAARVRRAYGAASIGGSTRQSPANWSSRFAGIFHNARCHASRREGLLIPRPQVRILPGPFGPAPRHENRMDTRVMRARDVAVVHRVPPRVHPRKIVESGNVAAPAALSTLTRGRLRCLAGPQALRDRARGRRGEHACRCRR